MKLYYFPSPNPQKVKFALNELGMDCEMVPVDLSKGEQRKPEFLALNPCGRLPVLTDGEVVLWESHAILAYLGEKSGRLWPTTVAGRGGALRWMFFLAQHVSPSVTDIAFNRLAVKVLGIPGDEDAIARGYKALPDILNIVEGHLVTNRWMLGNEFSLVECDYGPVLNVLEKAGFEVRAFPHVHAYLEAIRSRVAWRETPKLPGL
jgi:glutathione S-transferase